MKSSIKKWGKEITYSVERDEAWMVVKEGPWFWTYIFSSTKNAMIDDVDLKNVLKKNKPEFVNRKGMNDLLIHFGVGEEVRSKLFEKKEERVEVDV